MEPTQLPLVATLSQRYQSLTVDPRLVNAFAEKGQGEGNVHVYKRPAFKLFQAIVAGSAQGLYNWEGNIYAIIAGKVYKNGVDLGVAVSAAGLYTFTSVLGATPRLFFQNGAVAYTLKEDNTFAQVTNINYPSSVVPGAVYLDGTVYVMDSLGNITGSTAAANDPLTWDPLNLIKAQIEPKTAIYLAKQLVFLFALKTGYSEAFYDAGNATGSPLAPVAGAKLNFGCFDVGTVKDVGGDLIWVANSDEGFPCVIQVANLRAEIISTPVVERILAGSSGPYYCWNAKVAGHRFYAVSSVVGNFTLVYDLTSQLWYEWTNSSGNYLQYRFSCPGAGNSTLFLHETNGNLYTLDLNTFVDGVEPAFSVDIYTDNYDGGARALKVLQAMEFIGDQAATTLSLRYSDDDYQTWSAARVIDMSMDRPITTDLGAFTKRAFNLTHRDTTSFRLKMVNMFLTVGSLP